MPFKKTPPYDGRSKAGFRALRERVGLTQENVAKLANVNVSTVKRWEKPGYMEPPRDAWEILDSFEDYQCAEVRRAVDSAAGTHGWDDTALMAYYRNQAQYEAATGERRPYGAANAIARAIANELSKLGIDVSFEYPSGEEPGALH